MNNLFISIIVSLFLLLSSCASAYKELSGGLFLPHTNTIYNHNDSIKVVVSEGTPEQWGNKRLIRRAKRHNYHVINLQVTNMSSKFRKGFQLKYYVNDKRLIPVNISWFAKKTRQKGATSTIAAIPFIFLEMVVDDAIEDSINPDDLSSYSPYYIDVNSCITPTILECNNAKRKQENAKQFTDLRSLDLSYKTLPPGKPVYGIIILHDDICLNELNIRIKE